MNKYPCPYCKQPRGADYWGKVNKKRGENIKLALSKVENKGRKRKSDYEVIYTLRDKGLSMYAICKRLKISRGSVQYALKKRKLTL